ncbi:hypothetical protein FRC07_006800 [Ceratobasidium sp. 392]|nr:hypothetical protein FRC07_006800 [Ceratobasidium sp. 392]
MPPRKKNPKAVPSSRATRSQTAAVSRQSALPNSNTRPDISDVARSDRGMPLEALLESESNVAGREGTSDIRVSSDDVNYGARGSTPAANDGGYESNGNQEIAMPVPSSTRKQKSVRILVPEQEQEREQGFESEDESAPSTPPKRKRPGRPSKQPAQEVEEAIDESDLVRPPNLQCFVQVGDARKRLELGWDANFQDVEYQVSNITKIPTWQLEMAYSNDTMKRNDRCFITNEAELKAMLHEADVYYRQEIDALRNARVRVAQAKRRRRGYIPKTTKTRINELNTTFYNMKSPTEKPSESKAKGKSAEDGPTKAKSRAEQRAQLRQEITAKLCNDCEAVCVEVPAAGTSGSKKHVTLGEEDIDLWADLAVRGTATTANPPPALLLKLADKPPHSRKQKEGGPSNSHAHPNTIERHSPFPTHPNPSHYPFSNFPHPSQPSPFSSFPYGMPPFVPQFGLPFSYPPSYPPYFPPMSIPPGSYSGSPGVANSPWLADWLPSLDIGERGRFGDGFGALVPGFAAARIFRVSQLRNHTEEDLQHMTFYTKTGSEYHLSAPAAARLVGFIQADAPLIDPPHTNPGI